LEAPTIAVIDLKNVTLWLTDGSTSTITGAINNSPDGYPKEKFLPNASSTIIVGGVVGIIQTGQYITFDTHMQIYEVIDHTETAGNTTELVIFPCLQMDVAHLDPFSVIGNAVYVKVGDGNLTYSEKRNLNYIRDRGYLDTVRRGDDEAMDIALDFTWEFLRSASGEPASVEEALKQIGNASDWVSTSVDPCESYAVDIVMLNIPPCGNDAESITLPEFRWNSLGHDMRAGRVAIRGTCNRLQAEVVHAVP
jgi:hypothetical protein